MGSFIFGQITYFLNQKLCGGICSVLFNLITFIKELTSGHLRKISANICVHATTIKIIYMFSPILVPRTLIWTAAWTVDLLDIYLVSCHLPKTVDTSCKPPDNIMQTVEILSSLLNFHYNSK